MTKTKRGGFLIRWNTKTHGDIAEHFDLRLLGDHLRQICALAEITSADVPELFQYSIIET